MELLKTARRRSVISETLYVALNILLAIALFATIYVTGSIWLGFILIALSKWRVFAVRLRYWVANIRANVIDTVVGVGFVIFLSAMSGSLATQLVLTALYAAWLVIIKPRSKRSYVSAQAMIGLLVGLSAIVQLSTAPLWSAEVVVLASWLVGYSATRHVLSIQHEPHINFLSLLWAFVIAEIMWMTYHWTIGYSLIGSLQLSQVVVVIGLLSFLAERVYLSAHRNGRVRSEDIMLPALLTISVIGVLLFVFGATASI